MTYITFEGIDGSGKSTQFRHQVRRLRGQHGVEVKQYQYSAKDNPVGQLIRRIHGQNVRPPLPFITKRRSVQEILYALNARQNLRGVESPNEGILLSDRSVITAYASHIGLLPNWLISLAEPRLYPDLAIYIEVPPEVGIERIAGRETLFLEEDLESLRLFDANYREVFAQKPKTLRHTDVQIVDGNRPFDEVALDISTIVDDWIASHKNGVRANGRKR